MDRTAKSRTFEVYGSPALDYALDRREDKRLRFQALLQELRAVEVPKHEPVHDPHKRKIADQQEGCADHPVFKQQKSALTVLLSVVKREFLEDLMWKHLRQDLSKRKYGREKLFWMLPTEAQQTVADRLGRPLDEVLALKIDEDAPVDPMAADQQDVAPMVADQQEHPAADGTLQEGRAV